MRPCSSKSARNARFSGLEPVRFRNSSTSVSVIRPPDERFGSCLTKERPEAVSRISCQRSPLSFCRNLSWLWPRKSLLRRALANTCLICWGHPEPRADAEYRLSNTFPRRRFPSVGCQRQGVGHFHRLAPQGVQPSSTLSSSSPVRAR